MLSLLLSTFLVISVTPGGVAHAGVWSEDGPTEPWTWPERIPQYNTPLYAPLLVADGKGVAHAFNLEATGATNYSIIHRTWSIRQGWSAPVDVLLPEYLGLAPMLMSVYLDAEGIIHLAYFASSQTDGDLFYSQAPAENADRAEAWSEPVPIGTNAAGVAAATLGGNSAGDLVMLYGGSREGLGLYAVHSLDGGSTWSVPARVWQSPTEQIWPSSISVTSDATGRFHAVWDTANALGQGSEITYAALSPDLETTEHTTTLARQAAPEDAVGAASILASGVRLIVVYQDKFPPTKMMRISDDGGLTWSMPARPFPYVGGYGDVAMVEDSLGKAHMVLGNRFPIPETHGMWYSQLEGSQWTPLEPIISGPRTDSFDPCCPKAVVCNGNILLATWPHNVTQENLTGAWFAYRVLEAPPIRETSELDVTTSAAALVTPETVAEQTPTPVASATPTPLASDDSAGVTQHEAESNPGIPVYLGVIPVAVLMVAALFRRVRPAAPEPPDGSPEKSPEEPRE